jgi:hypothetical protein
MTYGHSKAQVSALTKLLQHMNFDIRSEFPVTPNDRISVLKLLNCSRVHFRAHLNKIVLYIQNNISACSQRRYNSTDGLCEARTSYAHRTMVHERIDRKKLAYMFKNSTNIDRNGAHKLHKATLMLVMS